MPRGRPLAPLTMSPAEREELVSITRSRSMPQSLATRARIVLLAAQGESNTCIAKQLGLSLPTVGIWRKRYGAQRIQGLYDEPRPGGPRSIRDEEIATLLRKTLKTKPKDGTHWTCRSIAAETRLSKSTVQRVWKAFGLQPHRQKHFKISTDPSSSRRCTISSGSTSIHLTMRSCSASTRRAKSKRSIVPNPCYRSGLAMSKESPTITSATEQPPCLPHSMSPRVA